MHGSFPTVHALCPGGTTAVSPGPVSTYVPSSITTFNLPDITYIVCGAWQLFVFALLGLFISWFLVRDTREFTLLEIKKNQEQEQQLIKSARSEETIDSNNKKPEQLKFMQVFAQTS